MTHPLVPLEVAAHPVLPWPMGAVVQGGDRGLERLPSPWVGQGFRSDSPEVEEAAGPRPHP